MLEVPNVAVPLDAFSPGADSQLYLRRAAARALGVRPDDVSDASLRRRGIDARKKADVHFVCTLWVRLRDAGKEERILAGEPGGTHGGGRRSSRVPKIPAGVKRAVPPTPGEVASWPGDCMRPLVVGMGPAGLFAALQLARAGARPLVVERGQCVEERARTVAAFDAGGPLDPASNIQFGEGGAGTFSDGKLTTNTKSPRIAHVLQSFVDAGAPPEILWEAHPHIGSDRLPDVVRALREEIRSLGGEVRFETRLDGVVLEGGVLTAAFLEHGGVRERVDVRQMVLATGHSARDTFQMLLEAGLAMEPKPFSVGVRIEHRQEAVNRAQWGAAARHPALGAAEYKLVEHLGGEDPRTVYSFCMCPGGTVVCAASEEGGVVVNGMSNHARDGVNANAALLVGITPDDFGHEGPLGGMLFQREIERRAFELVLSRGGSPYQAPAQTVGSFLRKAPAADGREERVQPTYARGTVACDLHECLPPFVCEALERAIPLLDRKLKGFAAPEAVMTAPETRSSSPVRILRADDFQAQLAPGIIDAMNEASTGIYPCGEGPGYAGGIMSAAVDGLRVADAILAQARERYEYGRLGG